MGWKHSGVNIFDGFVKQPVLLLKSQQTKKNHNLLPNEPTRQSRCLICLELSRCFLSRGKSRSPGTAAEKADPGLWSAQVSADLYFISQAALIPLWCLLSECCAQTTNVPQKGESSYEKNATDPKSSGTTSTNTQFASWNWLTRWKGWLWMFGWTPKDLKTAIYINWWDWENGGRIPTPSSPICFPSKYQWRRDDMLRTQGRQTDNSTASWHLNISKAVYCSIHNQSFETAPLEMPWQLWLDKISVSSILVSTVKEQMCHFGSPDGNCKNRVRMVFSL